MGAYTFDRFLRDCRNVGDVSFPVRLFAWLNGRSLKELDEIKRAAVESSRSVEAVRAVMSLAERANPGNIRESRWLALADAANVTDEELAAIRHAYSFFARTARDRRIAWWQEMSIYAVALLLPVLLVVLVIGVVWLAIVYA